MTFVLSFIFYSLQLKLCINDRNHKIGFIRCKNIISPPFFVSYFWRFVLKLKLSQKFRLVLSLPKRRVQLLWKTSTNFIIIENLLKKWNVTSTLTSTLVKQFVSSISFTLEQIKSKFSSSKEHIHVFVIRPDTSDGICCILCFYTNLVTTKQV